MTLQTFGKDRSQRFNAALKRCPYARVNELLPLLLLFQREDIHECSMIDMASGTGYVTDLFKTVVKSVIRVDKSPEMMVLAQEDGNAIYADLREISSMLGNTVKADIVTCLAALHHVCEIQDGKADARLSVYLQNRVVEECVQLLAPGGRVVFVDVCVPELLSWEDGKPFSRRMEHYYQQKQAFFQQQVYPVDPAFWSLLMQQHPDYFLNSSLLSGLPADVSTFSLAHLVDHQHLHYVTEQKRTLVVDFFDEVVANYSIDGHIAYFPREQQLRSVLERCGLENILVTCLPTPWKFCSELEAIWFVRELFSLGEQAIAEPGELARHPLEYQRIKEYIELYLGMSTEEDIVSINWQLVYAYGERAKQEA